MHGLVVEVCMYCIHIERGTIESVRRRIERNGNVLTAKITLDLVVLDAAPAVAPLF